MNVFPGFSQVQDPRGIITDLLDAPKKAHVFTKIDLHHAYHLIWIANGEEWKTTFCTHYGSFEWLVMPFGLTNSSMAFQRFMNDIFSDFLNMCVISYFDNILIYLEDMTQHNIRNMLRKSCSNSARTDFMWLPQSVNSTKKVLNTLVSSFLSTASTRLKTRFKSS